MLPENLVVRPVIEANADHVLQEMMEAEYGEHNLIIYPNLTTVTEI